MIREVKFESQDRRIKQILAALNANGIKDIEEANAICEQYGLDPYKTCEETQPICFENAKWAYVVGCAIALKKGCKNAAEAAEAIGIGLQSFCIPGSVADDRKVGLGHGNLAAMLLREETKCFAFLAGHESFAAAEGAIKIAAKADKVRKEPLRCILNGLGKDAAQIISRINGFTYVQTQFDYYTGELKVVKEIAYSDGPRAKVKCYGADDVREGVAIMWKEGVDVSITGNSTNPTRFQHPVAGTYKKERVLAGKPYFSVASGGGTGRTLHPDNMAAGPASYGMTDTMGRMHSDAQFAGSSSVPAQTIAWVAAVLFAFVTNKWWVFESHTLNPGKVWREFVPFVLCRVATFLFNLAALFVMVDLMKMEFFLCKLLISVVVVILNYVFSKILIFTNDKNK